MAFDEIIDWNLSGASKFLNSKNAKQGEVVEIVSEARQVPSKFNKDKDGNPLMDMVVDVKMEDGSEKEFKLNRASRKNLADAGYQPNGLEGVKAKIGIFNILVRGEQAKSVVLSPLQDDDSK